MDGRGFTALMAHEQWLYHARNNLQVNH